MMIILDLCDRKEGLGEMSTPSLRQQAYEQILMRIQNGDLPRGSATSEVQLSRELDMSRTPVRAALQQLELEGFVRIASKHGILILDSSSQRVSDLLDVIASLTLYAVSAAWHAKHEEIAELAAGASQSFERRPVLGTSQAREMVDFEYDWFGHLIALCNNKEMSRLFQSAALRLFWHDNAKRWQAPYTASTSRLALALADSLAQSVDAFREALLAYVHNLKLTWD